MNIVVVNVGNHDKTERIKTDFMIFFLRIVRISRLRFVKKIKNILRIYSLSLCLRLSRLNF